MSFICKRVLINLMQNNVKQQIRYYSRWTHRKPVNVIPPEKYQNMENDEDYSEERKISPSTVKEGHNIVNMDVLDSMSNPYENNIKEKKPQIKKKQVHVPKKKPIDMLQTVIDANGSVLYTKMQDKDIRIG